MRATTHIERTWTGQASALSWHYDFDWVESGNRSVLRLRLYADDSTGGNTPHCVGDDNGEILVVIKGAFEAREFTAVLLDLAINLTANGVAPWEIYPTRELYPSTVITKDTAS
jgi:hypothetical protein